MVHNHKLKISYKCPKRNWSYQRDILGISLSLQLNVGNQLGILGDQGADSWLGHEKSKRPGLQERKRILTGFGTGRLSEESQGLLFRSCELGHFDFS